MSMSCRAAWGSGESQVSLIASDTFNAAGLNIETLLNEQGAEKYPGSVSRFHTADQGLIDAYYLDWDILSYVQDNKAAFAAYQLFHFVAPAIGKRHEMDGPVDFELTLADFVDKVAANSENGKLWSLNLGTAGAWMGLAHTSRFYNYGLMVRENPIGIIIWDIYGHDLGT